MLGLNEFQAFFVLGHPEIYGISCYKRFNIRKKIALMLI